MSTIKSSSANLTLNADGSGNDIKFQSNAVEKGSLTDGGVFTATSLVDGDGGVVSRQPNPVIINGDMQVSQRAASVTGKTSSGYYVTDRFKFSGSDCGTWTIAQEALSSGAAKEAGFSSATRLDCTTADASVAADSYLFFGTKIEGFDLQSLAKGTSGANAFTIAFWVKSSTTGTYVLSVRDANSRHCGGTYAISSADTWEKKIITIAADTSGAITNHAGAGLNLDFWLAAGTDYSTGTMPTAWETLAATDRGAGLTHQMSSSTSKDWAITGVQLEVGTYTSTTLPPFQHENYGDNLIRCQRYHYVFGDSAETGDEGMGLGVCRDGTVVSTMVHHPVNMRTDPTLVEHDTSNIYRQNGTTNGNTDGTAPSIDQGHIRTTSVNLNGFSSLTNGQATTVKVFSGGKIGMDAEL